MEVNRQYWLKTWTSRAPLLFPLLYCKEPGLWSVFWGIFLSLALVPGITRAGLCFWLCYSTLKTRETQALTLFLLCGETCTCRIMLGVWLGRLWFIGESLPFVPFWEHQEPQSVLIISDFYNERVWEQLPWQRSCWVMVITETIQAGVAWNWDAGTVRVPLALAWGDKLVTEWHAGSLWLHLFQACFIPIAFRIIAPALDVLNIRGILLGAWDFTKTVPSIFLSLDIKEVWTRLS